MSTKMVEDHERKVLKAVRKSLGNTDIQEKLQDENQYVAMLKSLDLSPDAGVRAALLDVIGKSKLLQESHSPEISNRDEALSLVQQNTPPPDDIKKNAHGILHLHTVVLLGLIGNEHHTLHGGPWIARNRCNAL